MYQIENYIRTMKLVYKSELFKNVSVLVKISSFFQLQVGSGARHFSQEKVALLHKIINQV